MNSILRKIIDPCLSLLLFAAAIWLLHKELRTYHLKDIVTAIDSVAAAHLWAAAGLTILSYAVMTGYDSLAVRYVRQRFPILKSVWHPLSDMPSATTSECP